MYTPLFAGKFSLYSFYEIHANFGIFQLDRPASVKLLLSANFPVIRHVCFVSWPKGD